MVTVQDLIDRLSRLPSDALVEVLTVRDANYAWAEHIVVSNEYIDLETDIEYVDHRATDPVKFPSIGGKHWVVIGRNDS